METICENCRHYMCPECPRIDYVCGGDMGCEKWKPDFKAKSDTNKKKSKKYSDDLYEMGHYEEWKPNNPLDMITWIMNKTGKSYEEMQGMSNLRVEAVFKDMWDKEHGKK